MPKENLYCIPYNKNINTKNGIVYHCNRESVDIKSPSPKKFQCHICLQEFKDERCLKIHKTKMKHWFTPPVLNPMQQYRQKSSTVSSSRSSRSKSSTESSTSDLNASQKSSLSDDMSNALKHFNLKDTQKRERKNSTSPKTNKKSRVP
jgi:BRCT domain type II-containing protein